MEEEIYNPPLRDNIIRFFLVKAIEILHIGGDVIVLFLDIYSHLVNPYRDILSNVGRWGKKERQSLSVGIRKRKFQIFRNNKRHKIQSNEGPNIVEMIHLFRLQNTFHQYRILTQILSTIVIGNLYMYVCVCVYIYMNM